MSRKIVVVWIGLAVMISSVVILVEIAERVEAPTTLYVGGAGGGNYTHIQWAIDNASSGDTVYVYNGTYYECVVVNTTIDLIGEDMYMTVIDGLGSDDVVTLNTDWINITGFTIKNSSNAFNKAGLLLNSVQFCHISDNYITSNNYHGIYIYDSMNNNITKTWISSNSQRAIIFESSSNNNISNNNISNPSGVRVSTSSNNVFYKNNIWNCGQAIRVSSSPETKIIDNNFTECGVELEGFQLSDYNSHYIPTNNLLNNKPIYYYRNCSDLDIDGIDAGQVIIANCTRLNISNLTIDKTSIGIQLAYSSDINIRNNTFSSIWGISIFARYQTSAINITNNHMDYVNYGARFEYSSYNNVSNNNFTNSGYPIDVVWDSNHNIIKNNNVTSCSYAIDLGAASYNSIFDNYLYDNHVGTWIRMGSRYNIFRNNTFSKNDNGMWVHSTQHNKIEANNFSNSLEDGISVENAVNITVENNNISLNNGWGISLFATSDSTILRNDISNPDIGIRVRESSNNVIKGNNITLNAIGVFLKSSSNNIFVNNNISGNLYGINTTSSSSNGIYHNLIADNTYQAYDDRFDNYWDNGYPSGGNYWSDYSGVDNFKGPNQDIPGSDGIGDTPYIIDTDSQDNYPLMEPFTDKPLENFTILHEGWNLISIPLIQSEQNLKKVLEMIDGFYDAVQWYNASDSSDQWKHYQILKSSYLNDLTDINHTMGFWIHITKSGDTIFLYNGIQPTSNQTIALLPGWNQVGYPSLTSYNRTMGLNNISFGLDVDCIQWYDAKNKTWHFMGPDDYFVPGIGYWVHSKVEAGWEVPL